MSNDQLVNAYVEGSVSRRTFIRRLVTGGVSLGAAISYAHLLGPGRASAETGNPDFYASSTPAPAGTRANTRKRRRRRRRRRKKH